MNGWTLQGETGDVRNASLDAVLRSFDALAETDVAVGLGLTDVDENTQLMVSFDDANKLGYYLIVRERDEGAEQVLVDLSLGSKVVVGNIGGQGDERPRFVFVHYDLARKAVRSFFQAGRRDAKLDVATAARDNLS